MVIYGSPVPYNSNVENLNFEQNKDYHVHMFCTPCLKFCSSVLCCYFVFENHVTFLSSSSTNRHLEVFNVDIDIIAVCSGQFHNKFYANPTLGKLALDKRFMHPSLSRTVPKTTITCKHLRTAETQISLGGCPDCLIRISTVR